MLAAQILDAGTVYLIIGAALIFGACAYAAKRILRQLTMAQVGLSALITIVTLIVIWTFIAFSSRKRDRDAAPMAPEVSQPAQPLQPAPD